MVHAGVCYTYSGADDLARVSPVRHSKRHKGTVPVTAGYTTSQGSAVRSMWMLVREGEPPERFKVTARVARLAGDL